MRQHADRREFGNMKIWLLFLSASIVFAQSKPRTVLDGIYTSAQAERGKSAYNTSCANCHKADLTGFSGPPLTGTVFLDRWREFRANVLYDVIRISMPKDAQAPLAEAIYLDIFAYLLQANEIPDGATEMKTPVIEASLLVGKDGPRPLPSSSQVGAVGCLTLEVGTGWFLKNSGEPFRTLDGFEIKPQEVEEAKSIPLAGLLFRLQNITDLPTIDLRALDGTKVEVKGVLVRQPKNERINVTTLKPVSVGCGE
jgi:hypothetical protein